MRTLVLLLVLAAAGRAGEPFAHPAGAWRLTPPDTWAPRVHFDPNGVPYWVFTPDPGNDPLAYRRGLWVHAVPIPTDRSLDLGNLLRFTAAATLAAEPGLRCDPDRFREVEGGGLRARVMEVAGTHHTGGAWKGETYVALQDDNFLVVSYGGPPEEWESIRAAVAATGFEGAAALRPKEAAERPEKREKADEVMPRLRPATPLVTLLGSDPANPLKTVPLEAYGTGFIVSPDGYVVTARRVIRRIERDGRVLRTLFDPVMLSFDASTGMEPVRAEVVAVSWKHDLALLRIEGARGPWPFLPLAEEGDVRLAHRALLAGWPDPRTFGKTGLTQNEGSVSSIPRDAKGRPLEYRLGARAPTGDEGGNAGGPVYDLYLGGVIGVLSYDHVYEEAEGKVREVIYESAVPATQVLWEFPQVAASAERALSEDEGLALMSYWFLQERYGAALIQCDRLLERSPRHGLAHAYRYRMLAALGDTRRAEQSFKIAATNARTELPATLFAADAALARGDAVAALKYAARAMQLAPALPTGHFLFARALDLQDANWVDRQCGGVLGMTGGAHPGAHALLGANAVQKWLRNYRVMSLFDRKRMPDAQRLEAEMHLEKALDLWPSRQGLAHVYLAILAGFAGDARALEEHRALALAESAGDVEVLLRIAYLDLLAKRPMLALEVAGPLIETSDHPGVHVVLGWAKAQIATLLYFQGEKEKAAQVLQVARAHLSLVSAGGSGRRAPGMWEEVARYALQKDALAPPPGFGK